MKSAAIEAQLAITVSSSVSDTLLHNWSAYIDSITDTPPVFVTLSGLRAISIIVGRKPIRITPSDMYVNLYLLFIAPSGKGRKSTIKQIMNQILVNIPIHRTTDTYTPEYLASQLAAHPEARNEWDECSSVLSKLNNDKHYFSGISEALMRIYGCDPDVSVGTQKEGSTEIKNPYFNVLWLTTRKRFVDNVKARNIDDGFLAKMLCVYDERIGKSRPRKNLEDVPEHAENLSRLQLLVETCFKVFHDADLSFKFSKEALDIVNKFTEEQETKNESIVDEGEKELMNAISTRLEEYLIKFSALYEIDSEIGKFNEISSLAEYKPPREILISESSAEKSYKLTYQLLNLLNAKLLNSLKESRFSKLVAKFAKLLEDGKPHDRSGVQQVMHCENSREFDSTRDELIRQGKIRKVVVDGSKAEWYQKV
jgi:hypothetical protein